MMSRRVLTVSFTVVAMLFLLRFDLSAQEMNRVSPLYFGPNALPVPDMLDGTVSERFYAEIDMDVHKGFYGDMTETIFAKVNIPLFTPRVNLSLWMPVVEFYRNTTESFSHFQPEQRRLKGSQVGNVYVSADIHVFKEKRIVPDVAIRAAIITASGDGDEYSRYYDAPGYFFDAAIAKSVQFRHGFWRSLRGVVSGGFLCWQVTKNTQDDAFMYGLKAIVATRLFDVSFAWQGYSGWKENGDKPMVIKTDLVVPIKHFRPLVAYEYGIRDYPFHHFRIGVGYVF